MNLNLESTQSYIEQRIGDTTNTNGTNNQKLVIVLTVTLSIIALLAFIAIIVTAIIIYRRRSSTIRLKELHDSNRLRQIVVSLSPTSIRLQYSQKRLYHTHSEYQQPRTKTVVYNYTNTPTPSVIDDSLKGETNAAFDGTSLKNEHQPIVRTLSIIEHPVTSLQTEFPVSLQAPVPVITPTFVEAIATHRLTWIASSENTTLDTSASSSNNDISRDSGISYTNPSQKLLLFSQRTEF